MSIVLIDRTYALYNARNRINVQTHLKKNFECLVFLVLLQALRFSAMGDSLCLCFPCTRVYLHSIVCDPSDPKLYKEIALQRCPDGLRKLNRIFQQRTQSRDLFRRFPSLDRVLRGLLMRTSSIVFSIVTAVISLVTSGSG